MRRCKIRKNVRPKFCGRICHIFKLQAKTDKSNAGHYFDRMKDVHPEVCCTNFRFRGRGQRDTPITDVRGIIEALSSCYFLADRPLAYEKRLPAMAFG